ncbi:hypothetical protein PWT90_08599 [Aphanocladium album]|nr:hypothetical protein PWT90_08599 [Aphanocladium album]
MMTKVSAAIAFAALAQATQDHGGACSVVTITGTATIPTTTTTATDDNCSTRTICIDAVNECGMWYGGCIPDCKPYPPFSKPICPTDTVITTTPTSTPTTTSGSCSDRTICIDLVNECGMWYGGCVPDCKPYPTFSKPACPTDTVITTTATPTPTTTGTDDNCSTRSVCADYVNECGMWYGGCFPDCKPWPTFSKPACPQTTTLVTSIATPTH